MRTDIAHRLAMRLRRLAVTSVFPTRDEILFDEYQRNPLDKGLCNVHMLSLSRDLTYQMADATTTVDTVFELKVDGDPFKLCFNLCDRTVMNYVEGLPVRSYSPGELPFCPLTRLSMLAQPGTRARGATVREPADTIIRASSSVDDRSVPFARRPSKTVRRGQGSRDPCSCSCATARRGTTGCGHEPSAARHSQSSRGP